MAQVYGTGSNSTISGAGATQLHPHFYWKKALIDIVKEQVFMPLADVRSMP